MLSETDIPVPASIAAAPTVVPVALLILMSGAAPPELTIGAVPVTPVTVPPLLGELFVIV